MTYSIKKLAAGYLFQAELRERLTRELGVEWSDVRKGAAEIVGVPAELTNALSKRRTQILDALDRDGRSGSARESEIAALSPPEASRSTWNPEIERQLSERPESPADREQWERAAAAQESYALQYGQLSDPDITDTASLTGRQFDDFKQAIDLADKFINPPTPDLDRGLDLGP